MRTSLVHTTLANELVWKDAVISMGVMHTVVYTGCLFH